ncbi:cobalt-precorrin-5B (C(1))-methyltransferase [Butyrivibrio sp. YAB3001]|uniref:cobalt-precorrin-5B (C(1))-methyltransferase n=1 Tax=Butyrivibrio sp. YAB3001 TaxID=1520812 RepID=UPI0008F63A0B|nr:cobalt-precorrin-5B (C(1))-methyltransferase [Butyrivibrio sp. YAB3001]SFD01369.1 cobalt-precorrin-5B (C1)-methyltransferase [Butyrivibrio sp. YAB3001]
MDKNYSNERNSLVCPISTGDGAAAAAKAAIANLLFRINYDEVEITHANKSRTYPVTRIDANCTNYQTEYSVIIEGAAPPDIRERAEIRVRISYITDISEIGDNAHIDIRYPNLFMVGGEGIGQSQENYSGIKKGQALIEPEVRKMIFSIVADACDTSDGAQLLMITISCPDGVMLAAKNTVGQSVFSGGIEIVGNCGESAKIHQREITDSIRGQIERQANLGVKSILIAPGFYCADKINQQLHVPLTTAALCYNFPGLAIDTCVEMGIDNMLLVGNIGKLVKLAAGISNTHSISSDGRREIFASHTALVGGSAIQVRTVMKCTTCDEILSLLTNWGLRDKVMNSIMVAINEYGIERSRGKINFGVALFSDSFGLLGQTVNTRNVLVKVSQEQFSLSHKLK